MVLFIQNNTLNIEHIFEHCFWLDLWLLTAQPKLNTDFIAVRLDDYEKQQAHRYLNPKVAAEFATSRAQIKEILASYYNVTPKDLHFTYSHNGKPQCGCYTFSIAHAHAHTIFGITNLPKFGIDIEKIIDNDTISACLKFFHPKEREALGHSTTPTIDSKQFLQSFYTLWVRKEAVIKALDLKLLDGLQTIVASTELNNSHVLQLDQHNNVISTWHCPIILYNNFVIAYALDESHPHNEMINLNYYAYLLE